MISNFIKIFITVLSALFLLNTIVGWLYNVPTSSMENTILPGDAILVSKINYGARLNLNSFLLISERKYMASWRLPGFSHIKAGDVIVFDSPDYKNTLVKRCVGLPGDNVVVKHTDLYINNKPVKNSDQILYDYQIEIYISEYAGFLNKLKSLNIRADQIKYIPQTGFYTLSIPEKAAKKLQSLNYRIQKIEKREVDPRIFPVNKRNYWNRDNYGPILVPRKGQEIDINFESLSIYRKIIRAEGNKVSIKDSVIIINNKPLKKYTFKEDYYFVMGDNRDYSDDSRWIGFIAKKLIIGKAICVVFSKDQDTNGWNWGRFFKSVK